MDMTHTEVLLEAERQPVFLGLSERRRVLIQVAPVQCWAFCERKTKWEI